CSSDLGPEDMQLLLGGGGVSAYRHVTSRGLPDLLPERVHVSLGLARVRTDRHVRRLVANEAVELGQFPLGGLRVSRDRNLRRVKLLLLPRSEERRVGKECVAGWAAAQCTQAE